MVPETAMEMWGTRYPGVNDRETVIPTDQTEGLVDLTLLVTPFGTQHQAGTECPPFLAHTPGVHLSIYRVYCHLFEQDHHALSLA